MLRMTEDELTNYLKRTGKTTDIKKDKKKPKYKNNKVRMDGHLFDSQLEADYYIYLNLLLKASEINGYCLKPVFILSDKISYKPDFIVFEKDRTRIIDTKGIETDVFKLKKKLFEKKYNLGIEIIKKGDF